MFGYSGSGAGTSIGQCSAIDAVELLNDSKREHDWAYVRWDQDNLTVEFESKSGDNQIVETVTLQPTVYSEFVLIKKWEINNGFIQG